MSAAGAAAGSTARALTPVQRRRWVLEQLVPDGVHADTLVLRLVGQLQEAALSTALRLLAERHPVLTATVELNGEVPVLLPAEPPELAAPDDLRREAAPAEAARRIVEVEAGRPLDSATGPLLRARLIRVGATESWLVLRLHSLVADAASRPLLLADLASAYAAALTGTEPVWRHVDPGGNGTLPVDDATASPAALRWADGVAAAPPSLELPVDRPPAAQPELASRRHVHRLDPAATERLRGLADAESAEPGDVCLAALTALLHRYSGAGVVLVATPTTVRPFSAGVGLGRFEDYVALPVDLSGDPSLRTLVRRVRETRPEVPRSAPPVELLPRLPAGAPTAEVGPSARVAFRAEPALLPPTLPGLNTSVELAERAEEPFDLALLMTDHRDGDIELDWQFSSARFDPATVARVVAHFGLLLGAGLGVPDAGVSELDLLPEGERAELERLGRGPAPAIGRRTLPEWFADILAEHRDAEAVRGPDGGLTYAELDAASDRLAHRLRGVGVRPGATVAVCLDRCTALVAAVLAVLKAGAAYVPLDPAFPSERAGLLLRDAGPAALITSAELLTGLPPELPPPVLVDRDSAEVGAPSKGPVSGGPEPDDPAYVIYTSGSTGVPKGVVVGHAGLCNLLAAMAVEPGLRPGETMVGVTTPSFDLSVPDLFLPLVTGARLVLAEPAETVDGVRLARLLDQVGASLLQGTPSTWRLLLDSEWTGRPAMRAVMGGEAVPAGLAARIAERTAGVWNFYGPTEATVWSTAARLDGPDGPGFTEPLSIGRPLPGVQVAVVDGADRLAPLGVLGELLIGGRGVARGYLGRPELTERQFVRLPVGGGQVMYRSGDLVRWRTGGWLEFAGRIDHQVKLRGHRIELGEVEAALMTSRGVRDAVVVLLDHEPDNPRLVAYVAGPRSLDLGGLRAHLSRRLPTYMVPAAYVVLDELPRGANGKLDRSALRAPDPVPTGWRPHVAPRTPIEASLAALWAEVLGVERVGVHDDFFDLGGHSLLVLRVAARLPRLLPVRLPLRRLFELTTVESLAIEVTSSIAAGSADPDLADLLTRLESRTSPAGVPAERRR